MSEHRTSTVGDVEVLEKLRERNPDATEREGVLFEHLWRTWPYIPANLIDLTSGESVRDIINGWVEETYGLRFSEPRRGRFSEPRKGTR